MKLIWTGEAVEKLSEIEILIAHDSPERAERFVNYLIDRGELLVKNPGIGRVIPEVANPNIRELLAKNYRIVCHLHENQPAILTVFEGQRLLRIDEINID